MERGPLFNPMIGHPEFLRVQSRYFEAVDEKRFFHQTNCPYFSDTERALLEALRLQERERLLEVGCGEGGNLYLLGPSRSRLYGVDLFQAKLAFARSMISNCFLTCSSAEALPFSDGIFDVVFCRDVLHHLLDRRPALKEMWRVCRPGGRIVFIEPNGRNPMMRLQSWLVKAEALIRRNTPHSLQDLLKRELGAAGSLSLHQPLPFFRLVLHYRFGLPRLARFKGVGAAFDAINRVAGRVLPPSNWAYMVIEVNKR